MKSQYNRRLLPLTIALIAVVIAAFAAIPAWANSSLVKPAAEQTISAGVREEIAREIAKGRAACREAAKAASRVSYAVCVAERRRDAWRAADRDS